MVGLLRRAGLLFFGDHRGQAPLGLSTTILSKTPRAFAPSNNPQYQAFEVFTFGVIDVDGVIGRLVQLMEDLDFSLTLGCCRKNRLAKMILAYHLRTGKSSPPD